MPRRKSLVTVIREMVQQEVGSAIQSLLGSVSGSKLKPTHGRRRRRRKARGKKGAVPTPVAPKAKTVRRRRRHRRGPGSKTKAA